MKFLLFSASLLALAAPPQPTQPVGPRAAAARAVASPTTSPTGSAALQAELARTVASFAGTVGVAVRGVEAGDSAQVNGGAHLPMQSVYKFPLALAVLHQVELGRLQLDQELLLRPADLLPNTWSPLRERYPAGNVRVPLHEVLRYTVAESDNNSCDILFRLLGGPAAVQAYISSLGVADVHIAATEEEMHRREDAQYTNWATPAAMCRLFANFGRGRYLAPASRAMLWQMLATSPSGPRRLRAGLPPGTELAHKTGTSGTNAAGLTAATNDAGLLTLPTGQHVAVVVFVSNATAPEADCERLSAAVSRVVWRHFTTKS